MRLQSWLCGLALGWTAVAGLYGCASRTLDDGGAGGIVTPSDETETHRRARLRLELAVGYFEQGQTNVALDELKQVLTLDPDFAQAYNLRGLIYMRLNDQRLAEESLRRAVSLAPRDASILHNHGWVLCQLARYPEAMEAFDQALTNPNYRDRAKTLMAQGVCESRAGRPADAERSLSRAYELEPGNPVTGYNLAALLYKRGELSRSLFYIRRINNGEYANAESLWLGIRVERALNNRTAMEQLADQLKRRFPQSKETAAFERGAFDE